MTTISNAFTALGVGNAILVRKSHSVNYAISGTFVATLVLEYSTTGGSTWTQITSSETTVSSTAFRVDESLNSSAVLIRWRCSQFTSGTATATIVDVAGEVQSIRDAAGNVVLAVNEDGVVVTGTASISGAATVTGILTPGGVARTSQKSIYKAGAKAGTTAGWVVAAGDNVHLITCPASQTGSTLVVPISGLKVGDTITSYHLIGQIESAGDTVTVDADLRKQTAAAADVADASVGAITQLSVTADTIMSASNTAKSLATAETIGADETFYVLITATTGSSTDIALQGVAVVVTEA